MWIGDPLLHRGCISTVLTEIVGEYRIVVAVASVFGRHNPPSTDIPDEDQPAVPPGHDHVGRIEPSPRRYEFANVLSQGPQQRRWRTIQRR
jgi:hypothetical protein